MWLAGGMWLGLRRIRLGLRRNRLGLRRIRLGLRRIRLGLRADRALADRGGVRHGAREASWGR